MGCFRDSTVIINGPHSFNFFTLQADYIYIYSLISLVHKMAAAVPTITCRKKLSLSDKSLFILGLFVLVGNISPRQLSFECYWPEGGHMLY